MLEDLLALSSSEKASWFPVFPTTKFLLFGRRNFLLVKTLNLLANSLSKSPNLVVKLTSYERSLRNSDYQNRWDFCGTELASQKSRYITCRDYKYLCTCQTPSYVRNLPKQTKTMIALTLIAGT